MSNMSDAQFKRLSSLADARAYLICAVVALCTSNMMAQQSVMHHVVAVAGFVFLVLSVLSRFSPVDANEVEPADKRPA